MKPQAATFCSYLFPEPKDFWSAWFYC